MNNDLKKKSIDDRHIIEMIEIGIWKRSVKVFTPIREPVRRLNSFPTSFQNVGG